MDEAISWAVSGLPGSHSDATLAKAVTNATTEVAASVIADEIRTETIKDIEASSILRDTFELSPSVIDALPGIAPNEVRIFGGDEPDNAKNQISALLRLAQANLEVRMAEEIGVGRSFHRLPYWARS